MSSVLRNQTSAAERQGLCSIQIRTSVKNQYKSFDVLDKQKLQSQHFSQQNTILNLKNSHLENSQDNVSNISYQKTGKNINTLNTIQNPIAQSSSQESEMLVNVSSPPSTHLRRAATTQRHQSRINVQPKLPFTRNLESVTCNNNKSFTSVNIVLRQPSINPQSLIDITIGSNLTYSSSSCDTNLQYQNNYQITVSDDCGVFSAFRISPLGNNSRVADLHTNTGDRCEKYVDYKNSEARKSSCAQEIIAKQHMQKERISAVLFKNKKKLDFVQREVDFVIQTEGNSCMSDTLDSEIYKLRCNCQTLLNEIENSRKYGLTEESIRQIISIKSRQENSFPKYKSRRYLAPTSKNSLRN